ncbi:hypothetical protein QJQ45_017374, partial [Haematococcus lacustris]
MFMRPKPARPLDELPRMGKQEGVVNPLAHLDADWLGCDSGRTNWAIAAHEERYPSNAVESVWHRNLISAQNYRQSGITQDAKESKASMTDMQLQHDEMSLATNCMDQSMDGRHPTRTRCAVASHQLHRGAAAVPGVGTGSATAMWAELSKPCWSNARFWLYGGKQSTKAKFWVKGFQEQHAGSLGECTVEAAVMQALTALDLPGLLPHSAAMPLQRQVCWGRAARTDARVSAACNVASLCLPLPCNPGTQPRAVSRWLRRLQASLNCRLPPSLRLLTVELLPGALRTRPQPPAAHQPAC